MNQKPRRKYSQEFKNDAVKLVTEQGYRLSEAARNLDVDVSILRRWVVGSKRDKSAAFSGNGRMTPEQEEIRNLREENKRLLMEREILKKGRPSLPTSRNKIRLYPAARKGLSRHHPLSGDGSEPERFLPAYAVEAQNNFQRAV